MITLSDYITDNISESILSSTRTGKVHLDEELRKYGLDPAKAVLNADGTIDYDGNVNLNSKNLTNFFKLPFRFRKVNGSFYCSHNNLTTLEGCPEEVANNFFCDNNNLTSLKGGPKQVGCHYYCMFNKLTTLEGAPERIEAYFSCSNNNLTNFNHCPQVINGSFFCHHNQLTSLKGGPAQVSGEYDCAYNQLTSLEGLPKKLRDKLICYNNPGKFTVKDVLKVCSINKYYIKTLI